MGKKHDYLKEADLEEKILIKGERVHMEKKGNDGGLLLAAFVIVNTLAKRHKKEFPEVLIWLMNMWTELEEAEE